VHSINYWGERRGKLSTRLACPAFSPEIRAAEEDSREWREVQAKNLSQSIRKLLIDKRFAGVAWRREKGVEIRLKLLAAGDLMWKFIA
jgi:hypothetical protein